MNDLLLVDYNIYLINYPVITTLSVIIFSLLIGSFLNVLIYRLPIIIFNQWQEECEEFLEIDKKVSKTNKVIKEKFTLFSPSRSVCPKCNKQITAIDNIPLLSFIFLGGKCRFCKNKISWRYPFIELLAAVASVLVVAKFGLSLLTMYILFLSYLLIVIAAIDFEHMIIPDSMSYIGLWLGLLINLNVLTVNSITDIKLAILGAVIGYLILWSLYWLFKLLTGKEGFGHGDFKLTAMFGAWLGAYSIYPLLILASCSAIVITVIRRVVDKTSLEKPFGFGPYLVISGWLLLLYQDTWPLNYLNILNN